MKTIKHISLWVVVATCMVAVSTRGNAQAVSSTYFNVDWQFNAPVGNSYEINERVGLCRVREDLVKLLYDVIRCACRNAEASPCTENYIVTGFFTCRNIRDRVETLIIHNCKDL